MIAVAIALLGLVIAINAYALVQALNGIRDEIRATRAFDSRDESGP